MGDIKYYVGIDTGVNTGIAISSGGALLVVDCVKIHLAMEIVLKLIKSETKGVKVLVEDARLRKWIPKSRGVEALQGVGSVKRDAVIWDDYLQDLQKDYHNLHYAMIPPKANKTKTTSVQFKALTKWNGRTNEHSRDAAMLVFGL